MHLPRAPARIQVYSLSKCMYPSPSVLPLQMYSLTHTRAHPRARLLAGASFGTLLFVRHSLGTWTAAQSPACGLLTTEGRMSHGVRAASRARRLLLTTSDRQRLAANETNTSGSDAWVEGALLDLRRNRVRTGDVAIHDSRRRNSSAVALAAFSYWPQRATRTWIFSRCCPHDRTWRHATLSERGLADTFHRALEATRYMYLYLYRGTRRTAPPRSAQAGAHPLRNGASGRASGQRNAKK